MHLYLAPNPYEKLENTAKYVCNWINVTNELKQIYGYAIVSIISEKKISASFLLSKVLRSILETSPAIGVYQESQTLLIPKKIIFRL